MSLAQLEYILAVEKHRNFGKAAEECCVTQPTLSMQLQKFEEEHNVNIFDRTKKPIAPTREGVEIIEQAKRVISEYSQMKNLMMDSGETIAGDFKLAVIPTLAPYLIPSFVRNFSDQYKEINLIIEEYKTEDIIKLLQDYKIDAGLLVTPLHEDIIKEKVLYYEPFYLFVDPGHKMSDHDFIHQDELDLKDIWLLNKGNCFRDQVLNICTEKRELDKLKENVKFESGSFETLKNMVLKHSGYTILPKMDVDQLSSTHSGLVRKFEKPIPTREVSIVYNKKSYRKKVIESLEKVITESVSKEYIQLKNESIQVVEIY